MTQREAALEYGYWSRVNVRYYECLGRRFARTDAVSRITAVASASLSAVLLRIGQAGDLLWALCAFAALMAALGPVLRLSDHARVCSRLGSRFLQHAAAFEALLRRQPLEEGAVEAEVRRLADTLVAEAEQVPYRNERLFASAKAFISANWRHGPAADRLFKNMESTKS